MGLAEQQLLRSEKLQKQIGTLCDLDAANVIPKVKSLQAHKATVFFSDKARLGSDKLVIQYKALI